MTEASNICQLATTVLKEHTCHPHYHRIGLSGIQGVEAVLTILQDCYGWSYPGGLFLAAVDLLLEKEPVVRAVKQQLQRCTGERADGQQQQQPTTADSQHGSSTSISDSGPLSHAPPAGLGPQQTDTASTGRDVSAGNMQLRQQDSLQDGASGAGEAKQHEHGAHDWHQGAQAAASPLPQYNSGAAAADGHSQTPAVHPWHQDEASFASADQQQCTSRSTTKSPVGASTASAQRSRSSTPATPPAAHAGTGSSSKPFAAPGSGDKRMASPISATSPILQDAAARLAQQQRGKMMDSFQRRQHQQLQHLLFDAPSEVFTASLAGSMHQIELSAANSPQQIQAQHELQQELSRSSVSSIHPPRHSRHHQQQQQQQHWQPLQEGSEEQQQMLPQPPKAQEQQQLQETLQFARQPVHMPPSPVSTWQQWQQQQQAAVPAAASEPGLSPWRLQQLQQQEQNAASPMALPQPKHKQPPLSPPVQPPHTTSPAVTPLPLPLQQQYRDSPAASSHKQATPSVQPAAGARDAQGHSVAQESRLQQGQQEQPQQQQQQQQPGSRHCSPQQQQEQLQDLQELAGILQPVLYDDAAASEVLSEWLSGSDVAVAASPPGSDAATGPGNFVFQPPYIMPLQPGSAASTAGAAIAASPPVVPHMLHFTPLSTAAAGAAAAAAAGGGGSVGWNSQQGGYSGDRGGIQYASPAPGSAAATAAGATPHSAAHKQQLWVQQGTPSTAAASQGYSTGRRTVGSSVAHGTPRHVELSPGSSVTVQRATAAEGDDQSLVLDIDLAKVLDSSGTIVLQVRRDETGALTAAAALAPAATPAGTKRAAAAAAAAAGVQAGGVPRAGGLVIGASPVIGGKGRHEQHQGLPFGSISVDGSIGAAWAGSQQGTSSSQQQQQQHQHQQQGTEEEQPVHRVLRYSAEGRVSIGSFGGAVQDPAGQDGTWTNTADFSAVQQQQQQQDDRVMVQSLDFAVLQQQQQQQGHQQESDGLCSHASGRRPLANASWVMVDIQPSGQLSREVSQAASTVAAAPGQQQQQQQHEDAPAQVHSASAAAVKDATQMPEAASAPVPGADACSGTADAAARGDEMHAQTQQGDANFQQGLHPYQQALLQGAQGLPAPRTQRVSLEPPSTPLAGSVAGALLSMQPSDLAGADQSSLWPSESVAPTEDGVGGPAGSSPSAAAATAAAAVVAPFGPAAASAAATPAPAQGLTRSRVAGAEGGQAASPLPPELLPTETPAGFKFWGAAAGRGASGAGGLRYNAAQQTLESLSNFGGAAVAVGQKSALASQQQATAQCGVEPGALTAALSDNQQQQQQLLQLGLLGQSLELLGLSEADLGQFGLNQISLDLLGVGQMQSLEMQMLKALGAAAGVGEAGQLVQLPAARALAASAVKLLRQSMAVAAATRQQMPAPKQHKQQQQQQQGPSELAAAAVAAAAAAMALNNTRQYQSLELLPRQLLQSLQAAATAGATGAAQHAGAGPQIATTAAAATGAPQAEASQQEQQQLQGQESVNLPQDQQAGVRNSLTTWLADRFGADADLHKSVSLLLQELEQQQPQQQQQEEEEEEEPQADEAQPAQQQHIAQSQQQQQQQQQANESSDASQAAGSVSAEDPVAAHAAGSQTPGRPHACTAEGVDGGTAGAQSAAAAPTHAANKQQSAVKAAPAGSHTGAAVHDGDTSELCVTASPAPAWYSAMAQQQLQLQQSTPDAQRAHGHLAPTPHQGHAAAAQLQQQQQQQEGEEEIDQGADGSQGSWSNRVEQLLRVTQNSPDVGSDGTGTVLTEGSLGMTPSPSGFRYGPHTDHENHAAQDTLPGLKGGEGASDLTAAKLGVGESSVLSLFRTSVMTNPLYWVEPSSADLTGALAESAAVGASAAAVAAEGSVIVKTLASFNSAPTVVADAVEAAEAAPVLAAAKRVAAAAAAAAAIPEAQHTAEQAAAILQQYLPYSSSNSSSPCGNDNSGSPQQQRQLSTEHQEQPIETAAHTSAAASEHGSVPHRQLWLGATDSDEVGASAGSSSPLVASKGEVVDTHAGQGSPRTPRGALYGSFCEAAAAESTGPGNSTGPDNSQGAAQSAALSGGDSEKEQLGLQVAGSAVQSDVVSQLQDSAAPYVNPPCFQDSAAGSDWQEWQQQQQQQLLQHPQGSAACSGSAYEHTAAAGADSSVMDWQQQQQQGRQSEGSYAQGSHVQDLLQYEGSAASGAEGSPQDWQQQQPRWQVVSELDWSEPQAGHQRQLERQGDTGYAASLGLVPWQLQQQLQQTQQTLSNSPVAYTEVAAEGSWEVQQQWEQQQTEWQMLGDLQQQQPTSSQQQQQQQQGEEEEQDGEKWESDVQQGVQVQPPEPQSASRIQHLMQKLRDRRKQLGTPGGASPAVAAAAAAAAAAAEDDAVVNGEPAAEPLGLQAAAADSDLEVSTAGSRESAGQCADEQSGLGGAQPVGAGTSAGSAEGGDSADSAPAVSSSGSVGLVSAVEDTLCAAEAAMQQALLRVQLLHDQQQQQQPMAELLDDGHGATQQQQQQQQAARMELVQEQSVADRWQAWDMQMHLSEQQKQRHAVAGEQQQQQCAELSLPPSADTAAAATDSVVHSPAASNKRQNVEHTQMAFAPSSDAGAANPAGCGDGAAAVARTGAAGAAAGTESPSVKWVREVLQDSSTFSSYMQALARGDNTIQTVRDANPSRLVHTAQRDSQQGSDFAAGREGYDGKSRQLREQVAGKMSALLEAVQSGTLRDSCASSLIKGSDAEGSEDESEGEGPGPQAMGAKRAGMQHSAWHDRIQQLLAAADAAADSLTQPPVLPPALQRKAGAAAAPVARASVGKAAASAAVVRVPGVGLKYGAAASKRSAAAAAGVANKGKTIAKPRVKSTTAAAQGQGGRVQAVQGGVQRVDRSKPTKAAAAAAIMAARHAGAALQTAGTAVQGEFATNAQQQTQQLELSDGAHGIQPTVADTAAAKDSSHDTQRHIAPKQASKDHQQQKQQHELLCAQHSQDVVAAAVQDACAPDNNSASTSSNQAKAAAYDMQQDAAAKRRASFSLRSRPALSSQQPQQQEQHVGPTPVSQAAQQSRPGTSSSRSLSQPGLVQQPQPQQVLRGAAVLAARQRERLQQLTQQRQQQQLAQHDVAQERFAPAGNHVSAPAAADRDGRGKGADLVNSRVVRADSRAHVSSHEEQGHVPGTGNGRQGGADQRTHVSPEVRPEDSAVMHSPDAVYSGPSRSKAGQAKQQQLLLPAQGSLPVVVAAVGSGTISGSAAVTGAGASKQATGPKTTSMFDIERPKGYTFSTAKAMATADLAGTAEQPPTQQQYQHRKQQEQQTAVTDSRRQGQVGPSRSLGPTNRHSPSSVPVADAQASRRPAVALRQSAANGAQAAAAAAAAAVTPAALYRQDAGLQQEDSFSSQRSHGLSLRKGTRRQPSPVPAATVAAGASGSKQQQKQLPGHSCGAPRSAHTPSATSAAASAVAAGRRQAQQQQAVAHTHSTLRSEQGATPEDAHQRLLQPIFTRRPSNVARARDGAGVPSRVGSTTAGTVAAVAAVKAALAGFGTRGWQQQDVCSWLSKLRLDLLPEEPTAPLLSNPLRNGLLLAGIAASVTQQPLGGIRQPVTTLAAARANLLMSAARLSLVSAQFACSAEAAAARQDKDEALGGLGLTQRQQGPNTAQCDSPGFRAGRGRAGIPGATLPGSPVRVRGRSSAPGSPFKGGSSHSRSRSGSPNRSYQGGLDGTRGASGGGGLALDTSNACGCFVLVATGPGVHSLTGTPGYHPHQQQQLQMSGDLASVLTSPASSCCCDCWACQQLDGSVLEHAVLQLLELVMAGDTSCMWGLLYALQQAYPVIPGSMQGAARGASPVREAAGRVTAPAGSPQKQPRQQQQQQQQQQKHSSEASAAVMEAGAGCIVVQPLQGPSWRSFQLPYTAAELTKLEQHLLQWLEDLDIICCTDTPDWSCLSSELASGVLLAEITAALGLPHAVGIQERPVTAAARAGNIHAVLDVLQQLSGLPCKWLLQQHNAALTAGERPALTALLEAVWVWTTGQSQQGPWLRWAQEQQQQQQQQQYAVPGWSSVGSTGSSAPRAAGAGNSSGGRVRSVTSVARSGRAW